jgi:hypothetical protein
METQKNKTDMITKIDMIEFEEFAPERDLCKYCDAAELSGMVEKRITKLYLSFEREEDVEIDEDNIHYEARQIAKYCECCWKELIADLDH